MEGQEGEPGHMEEQSTKASHVGERLEQLFLQAETVKMINLRKFMEFQNEKGRESERDEAKLSQLVFKAIEIQLRILGEQNRQVASRHAPPAVEEVWEAMLLVPEVGALLVRDAVRTEILENLKEKMETQG